MSGRLIGTLAAAGLLAALSQTQSFPAAVAGTADSIALCHANKPAAVIGAVKLVKPSALDRYLGRGDCRITDLPAPTRSVCDRSDPDGDDFCGSDGMTCGDGAAPDGSDHPCACGDTVVTDTRLDAGVDSIVGSICAGNGLVLGPGIQLDLSDLTLTGSGLGSGLTVPSGGVVLGGTVSGFGTGLEITARTPAAMTTVRGTTLEGNTDEGVSVDVADSQSRVLLDSIVAQGNGGDGIHVRGAPGASNLDDAGLAIQPEDYGFALIGQDTQVHDNGRHGLHFGDASQTGDVAAYVDLGQVYGNAGTGVLLEQKSGLSQGVDCGASAGYPGCTGATLHGLIVHDNASTGVELHTGFLMPRLIATTHYGVGFTSNKVFHNAMGPGCSGEQTQPQVKVVGPVGLGNAACAAADEATCESNSYSAADNQHCRWTGSSCAVTWDLRGALQCGDQTANPNQIHSYNTNPDSTGSSELSVGMYASNGALVWADNNSWRTGDPGMNVDQDNTSFVEADDFCPVGGIILTCSSTAP